MLGILYTFLAAASFGLNNATVRRGVITGTVTQAVMVSMPIGLVMFAAIAALAGQLEGVARFSPHSFAFLVAAGLIHFVFGRYCNYRSIQAMGANLSAPIQQWTLLVTLVLAVAFLRESLDVLKLAGIALMVLGPAMAVGTQKARGRRAARVAPKSAGAAAAPAKFQPKMAEGYVFGILSCLAYGTSPILVRAGLEGSGLALAGGVVSYGASTIFVAALLLLLPMARREVVTIDRRNVIWFLWTGVTVCISQIFLYLAMAIAPVTVVQPLMRFSTVFRTLFSWLLNREHESFDTGLLIAIFISTVGAFALAFDAPTVARWLDAPGWLAAAFAWRWP